MKPLVLTLKHEPGQRLDLAPLVPHLLDGKSAKDIAAIELQTTRETITVGDIFKIRSGATESIRFEGGSVRLDNIGMNMKAGEIVIDGLTEEAVAEAMRAGLAAIVKLGPDHGAVRVGAGNYGGKLGPFHFHLKDLLP